MKWFLDDIQPRFSGQEGCAGVRLEERAVYTFEVVGSSPIRTIKTLESQEVQQRKDRDFTLAQSEERKAANFVVVGSIPTRESTSRFGF